LNELEVVQYHQLDGMNVFINTVCYRSAHFHHEWELLWVLDAPLKVTWQKKEFTLQPGDIVLFPPNLAHELHQTERISTFLCLQIASSILSLPAGLVTEDIVLKEHLTPEVYQTVRQYALEIAECYFYREPLYELQCLGKSALMMHILLKNIPCRSITAEEAANEDLRNARLMRLTQYVEENFTHKIRLADFAAAEGCSVSYLSHFIKNTMNQTFQDYVNSVRFRHACKLIAEGKLSMISISMESGFSDYRYFSKAFQKSYGMTPAEYGRKANTIITETASHIRSSHSQERFLTRGQSLGVLQLFRKQLDP
jgi:AraC-like DNA-binding protein